MRAELLRILRAAPALDEQSAIKKASTFGKRSVHNLTSAQDGDRSLQHLKINLTLRVSVSPWPVSVLAR